MYRVIIDPRRRWRWDAATRTYVEDHDERASTELSFPPRCPHCGGVATTTRTLSAEAHSSGSLFGDGQSIQLIAVPGCRRMPRPLPAYFGQLALAFLTVAATLATMATTGAAVIAVLALAGSLALWRARTWIHLPTVRDDVLVFEVRDAAYAHGLARLNHGRVDGRGPFPELPAGAELRAPLPEARIKK